MQDRRSIVRRNERDAENSRLNPEADADEQSAEEQPYDRHVHTLQHALGNAAFARLLTSDSRSAAGPPHIQRHPLGEELPNKDDQAAEVADKQAAPSTATRTATEEKDETKAATTEGAEFVKSQKLTPGAMSLSAAEKILQGSYGGFKKIVPGKIEILKDVAALSIKYDEAQMARGVKRPDGSAWKIGDNAKDDAAAGVTTQGFADQDKGIVYVNGATTLVTTTVHEILHNNTEPKFRNKAGETFNEGVTETLARKSLTDAGITVPAVTAYPTQVGIAQKLIDTVGLEVVEKAYFGDVEGVVKAYETATSKTWDALKTAAEALDKDKVDEAMKPKTIIWAGDDYDSGSSLEDGEALA
jgi:hypothetical protein